MKSYKIFLLLIVGLSFLLISSCAAPVKIIGYPGLNVENVPREKCEQDYTNVRVLGSLPPEGEYEEIGYIVVEQESSSELVYTSEEKQIKEARIKACQWGGDAIVIIGAAANKGSTYSVWSGFQWSDKRSNRIIIIKLIEKSKEKR